MLGRAGYLLVPSLCAALGLLFWIAATFVARRASHLYWLLPRPVKLQLGLEFALFWWTTDQAPPGRARLVLPHLEAARAAARDPSLRDRLARLGDLVRADDDTHRDLVARELKDCLQASNTPRPFYLKRLWFPRYLFAPFTLGMSGLTFLVAHDGAFQAGDAATVVSALLFFGGMFLLLFQLEDRWRTVRKKARTLFLTDRAPTDAVNFAVARFYSSVSHLVAIYVNGDPRELFLVEGHGADYFTPGQDDTGHVVDAFVDHADLVVVNVRDEQLAALVRARTRLPANRVLALSEEATAPAGFAWLDPMCLRMDPRRCHAAVDLDPAHLPLAGWRRPFLARPDFYLWLACPALFCFDGWRPLATFLTLAGLSWLLCELLGDRRRAAHSRTTLRAPRLLSTSRRINFAKLERIFFRATAAFSVVACTIAVASVWSRWYREPWAWFALVHAWLVVQFLFGKVLISNLLVLLKWWIDWNFRIVVFRRNAGDYAYAHKAVVMATCGRFGQVVSLNDRALGTTNQGFNEDREQTLGYRHWVLVEAHCALERAYFLHDWKIQVRAELDSADFAVFDWAEEVTENMKWELRVACARLPAHRLLVVHAPDERSGIEALLEKIRREGGKQPRGMVQSRESDNQYIWQGHEKYASTFAGALEEMLESLVSEPRTTFQPVAVSAHPMPA